jgi:hypothetical protein
MYMNIYNLHPVWFLLHSLKSLFTEQYTVQYNTFGAADKPGIIKNGNIKKQQFSLEPTDALFIYSNVKTD